jgi:sulfur-oxidizing protein SoxZ
MMMAEKPRVRVPKQAKKGEIVQIRTLLTHAMESGQRKDAAGKTIPRKIINKFSCEFNGKPVFSCDIEPAVAANPYLQFSARIEESGTFKFTWVDDDGSKTTAEEKITVA